MNWRKKWMPLQAEHFVKKKVDVFHHLWWSSGFWDNLWFNRSRIGQEYSLWDVFWTMCCKENYLSSLANKSSCLQDSKTEIQNKTILIGIVWKSKKSENFLLRSSSPLHLKTEQRQKKAKDIGFVHSLHTPTLKNIILGFVVCAFLLLAS